MEFDVIVIGAGAAGLVAAEAAASQGRRTLLLEKNSRPGLKILMSGGTRCNLTHATDKHGIVQAFGEQGPFLHSALARLSPADVVRLFEDEGVVTKIEPDTGKIFPASDDAHDVLNALLTRLKRSGATLALGDGVVDLRCNGNGFEVVTTQQTLHAAAVIVTTGGKSYPGSGTTGDGYGWLASLGHTIVTPRPALTPITTNAEWVRELRGVTIPDVAVRVLPPDSEPPLTGKRKCTLAERRSSLLFTHFGLSGPAALDVSRAVSGHETPHRLWLACDFLPDSNVERLDEQLARDCAADGKKQIASLIPPHLPRRLAETIVAAAGVDPARRAAELSKADRRRVAESLKALRIPVSGTMGFRKAEVTAGGVSRSEVDSRTMQSKRVPGLFLAGEVLDLDGPIGGYNFQAAFSTGMVAGESVP